MSGVGLLYEALRQSIHPAMRVCRKWGSPLLNDKTRIACDAEERTDWLAVYLAGAGFMSVPQATVVRAFGMETSTWVLWVNADFAKANIRHYRRAHSLTLTWDEGSVTESALVKRAFY